jgi:hypothetical protein
MHISRPEHNYRLNQKPFERVSENESLREKLVFSSIAAEKAIAQNLYSGLSVEANAIVDRMLRMVFNEGKLNETPELSFQAYYFQDEVIDDRAGDIMLGYIYNNPSLKWIRAKRLLVKSQVGISDVTVDELQELSATEALVAAQEIVKIIATMRICGDTFGRPRSWEYRLFKSAVELLKISNWSQLSYKNAIRVNEMIAVQQMVLRDESEKLAVVINDFAKAKVVRGLGFEI